MKPHWLLMLLLLNHIEYNSTKYVSDLCNNDFIKNDIEDFLSLQDSIVLSPLPVCSEIFVLQFIMKISEEKWTCSIWKWNPLSSLKPVTNSKYLHCNLLCISKKNKQIPNPYWKIELSLFETCSCPVPNMFPLKMEILVTGDKSYCTVHA